MLNLILPDNPIDLAIVGYDARISEAKSATGTYIRVSSNVSRTAIPNTGTFSDLHPSLDSVLSSIPSDLPETDYDIVAIGVPNLREFAVASAEIVYEVESTHIIDQVAAKAFFSLHLRCADDGLEQPAKWEFLGYDVGDVWTNVEHWPINWAGCRSLEPSWVNGYLVKSTTEAIEILHICNREWSLSAPFFPFGIFRMIRSSHHR